MRIETQNGNDIVCAYIFPIQHIKIGSRWQDSSFGIVTVEKIDIETNDIKYSWFENDEKQFNFKDSFSFQCRYCLIIEK